MRKSEAEWERERNLVALYHRLEADLAARVNPQPFSAALHLRLERITDLLGRLGDPQRRYPVVHVGGTSGKGSTAACVAAILQAHGQKVGLHLSPHLQILNERHQINGRPAATTRLWPLWQRMVPAVSAMAADLPSYFEVQVALSLLLFAEEGVDVAVVEVGLGGARDATNVLPARVAVLTNVGLDHTEILGDTPLKIAQDKAGIIKPGQHVLSGVTQPEVIAHVAARCRAVGASLRLLHRDFPPLHGVPLGMEGAFQADNAALAVEAARAFLPGLDAEAARTRQGLAAARLPGRLEQVQQQPRVLLDGAHNPDKIRAAAAAVRDASPSAGAGRCIAVVALKAGKDAAAILPEIDALSDEIILTRFYDKGLWHAAPPEDLRALLPRATVIADPLEAVQAALRRAQPQDTVWITGSLYLIGDVRALWFPLPALLSALEPAL